MTDAAFTLLQFAFSVGVILAVFSAFAAGVTYADRRKTVAAACFGFSLGTGGTTLAGVLYAGVIEVFL